MISLSVIIPVFNAEDVLHHCLRGLIEQKIENFEILVVDNNAMDKSNVIIQHFKQMDSRIRYVVCTRQGVSSARNMGIEMAVGDYIYFMDSDDDLKMEALAKFYSFARKSGAEAVFSNILYSKKGAFSPMDPAADTDVFVQDGEIPKMFYNKLSSYVMYMPFKFYKRQFLIDCNIRYDETLSLGEDVLFNIDVYRHARSVYYIAEPLYIYQITAGGLNSKYRSDFLDIKELLIGRIKSYLEENNCLGPNYYTVLMHDMFSIFVNETKAPEPDLKRIYNHPMMVELLSSNVFPHLPLTKKVVFLAFKMRWTRLLYLAAKVYMSQM